jgi:hypothetical protein
MANEAVIIELLGNGGDPIRYTVADGTAIAKGALLRQTDPRTAIINSGADQPIAGIAAAEKVVSDGSTTLAVYTNGIFDITAAAAGITAVGALCAISATVNMITAADASDILQGSIVGYCLEAHANDEVAAVRILK